MTSVESATIAAERLGSFENRLQALERAGQLAASTIQVDGRTVRAVPAIGAGVRAGEAIPGLQTAIDANALAITESQALIDALDLTLAQNAQEVADALAAVTSQIGSVESVAEQAAEDAQQAATAAQGAQQTAGQAQTAADAAEAAAGTAQTAADQAQADALAAAGLAGSKGEVITQASAPTGSRATSANLWIRSSDNRPHTWNGSAWVAVTDKVATDAAAAAVAAQTTATNAGTAASTAQQRADAAFQGAVDAATAAGNAMTAANGKNRTWWQTSAPAGTGHATGDTWFNTSAGTINRWSGSAWVVQELGAGALASGAVTEAKIAANAITVLKIANGAIEAGKIANGAVDATKLATAVANSITTAQSTATAAQTAAGTAQSTADGAASAASAAQTAANTAKGAADQAAADAAAAAGIAGGKADVLIQSTAPAAAMQKASTLWIDTTSNGNTPKRWSGSAWVAVTDKAATDAAAAASAAAGAASAAQGTANTAVSNAATAQQRADSAFSNAATAAQAAGLAQTTADGKNASWYTGTAPAGTGHKVGDLWYNSAAGNALSTWSGSAWVARQMGTAALASGAVTEGIIAANAVTVGKLLDGAVQEAKLAASAVTEGKLAALAVTAGKLAAGSVIAGKIAADAVTAGTIAANAITAREIVAGTITAASGIIANAAIGTAQIADLAVTSAKVVALDAAKITTGSLDAARIAANSISVTQLLVTNLANLIEDSGFESNSNRAWTLSTGGTIATANPRSGSYALSITPTTSAREVARQRVMSVEPGDEYLLSFWVRASATGAPANAVELSMMHGPLSTVPTAAAVAWSTTALSTGYVRFTGVWTVPATAKYAAPRIVVRDTANSRTYYVDDVEMHPRTGAELIVDGAITAGKLAANSVTAANIVAGTITANELGANSVTTAKIATNAVTANEILTGTITAASGIIANAAIGTAQIADLAVTSAKVVALDAAKITTGTLDAARIAALSIATGHLAANSITTAKIGANQVTATQIAADAVVARNIKAGEVVAGKLAANSVVSTNIAANQVTATHIVAGTITATELAAGAITTTKLAAGAIDGLTITGATIRTASSGQRMQFDANGLSAYDAGGNVTATLTSFGGSMELGGALTASQIVGGVYQRSAMITATGFSSSYRVAAANGNPERNPYTELGGEIGFAQRTQLQVPNHTGSERALLLRAWADWNPGNGSQGPTAVLDSQFLPLLVKTVNENGKANPITIEANGDVLVSSLGSSSWNPSTGQSTSTTPGLVTITAQAFPSGPGKIALKADSIDLDSAPSIRGRRLVDAGTTSQRNSIYSAAPSTVDSLARQGLRWYNTDLGQFEQWYALFNSTSNPNGASSAGWYVDDTKDVPVSTVGFQNGFGAGNPAPTFRRVNGWVYISGVITVPNGARDGIVWTLPQGFRPAVRHSILTQASAITRSEMLVYPNGNVNVQNWVSSSTSVAFELSYPVQL